MLLDGNFSCELCARVEVVASSRKAVKVPRPCDHFMSISSMNLNHENGLRATDLHSCPSRRPIKFWCHFVTHSSALDLEIMFPVELKVVAYEYEDQKFDQGLCRWVLDFSFLPKLLACLDAILMRNIDISMETRRVSSGNGAWAFCFLRKSVVSFK